MHDQQMYITPARAAETFLRQMSPQSRLVVTGQIGCGKTTLARDICSRLGLSHLPIDDFHGDTDPALSAARAASSIDGGWVAEATDGRVSLCSVECRENDKNSAIYQPA